MLLTFFLAVMGWIIFRAESIGMAWEYVCGMFDVSLFMVFIKKKIALSNVIFITIMLVVEWSQRRKEHGLSFLSKVKPLLVRCVIVVLIIEFILFFKASAPSQFIYFQF